MPEASSKSYTLARNTAFLYLRMIIVMLVSLYTSRVILRTLGFEDFGIYNVVGSVVVFMSFLQAALRNATSRYIAYDLGVGDVSKLSRTFSMAVNSHLLLAVVFFIGVGAVGEWFVMHKLNIPPDRLHAAGWAFLFSLATFCLSIVRTPFESNILAHEKMDFYALTSIVEVVLKLVVVFLLVISPVDKLIAYAFLLTMVMLILLVWYVIYCRMKFKDCEYSRCWDGKIFRQFTSYSGWSLLVNGATITRSQSINIFFNLFLGVLANTAMGIANQVVYTLNTFVTNFTQAFKPQIIKSWAEKDYGYFNKLVLSTSKISYFLLLLVAIPIVANIDYVLKLWLGEFPEMSAVFIETIIIYYLIDALQEPLVVSVHATGKLKVHQIMIAGIVFLVIPIAYIMLKCGCSGTMVLIMNALANLVCAICRTLYMRRLISLDLKEYLRRVVLPLAAITLVSLPVPLIMARTMPANFGNFVLISVVSVIISIAAFWFLGLNKAEKQFVVKSPAAARLLPAFIKRRYE